MAAHKISLTLDDALYRRFSEYAREEMRPLSVEILYLAQYGLSKKIEEGALRSIEDALDIVLERRADDGHRRTERGPGKS